MISTVAILEEMRSQNVRAATLAALGDIKEDALNLKIAGFTDSDAIRMAVRDGEVTPR